jgi:hypothetical protein
MGIQTSPDDYCLIGMVKIGEGETWIMMIWDWM